MLTSSEESPHVVVDVAVVVACLTRSCGDKEGARGGEVVGAQIFYSKSSITATSIIGILPIPGFFFRVTLE